jgi:hypothetical protein
MRGTDFVKPISKHNVRWGINVAEDWDKTVHLNNREHTLSHNTPSAGAKGADTLVEAAAAGACEASGRIMRIEGDFGTGNFQTSTKRVFSLEDHTGIFDRRWSDDERGLVYPLRGVRSGDLRSDGCIKGGLGVAGATPIVTVEGRIES